MKGRRRSFRTQRGLSLLEALLAIVILAFGILGLAGLQAKMQSAEVESYARSQALILLDDMAARLNANRANGAAYANAAQPIGTKDGQAANADCSGTKTLVDRDICEWSNALKGSTEIAGGGGGAVGTMIGGRGCIEQIAGANPPAYRISVAWQGLSPTVAPSIGCGAGNYGTDPQTNVELRRVVAKVVASGVSP